MKALRGDFRRQVPLILSFLALASLAVPASSHAADCPAGTAENPATLSSPASSMTPGRLAATVLNLLGAGVACLSAQQRQRLADMLHLALT
mmetsp:Transcript_61543/g.179871  ORF Transcript_61543/g.179871 Transcript_61543/m.179871 type:complete len:91 (-) Transcript_61543:54-326(-)